MPSGVNGMQNEYQFPFLLTDSSKITPSTPQFLVGFDNGFLPVQDPLDSLPEQFKVIDELLNEMPLTKNDGKPGLLATGDFGKTVHTRLTNLNDLIKNITDDRLLYALYRDYTFLASAYLLEPCHLNYLKSKDYGLGRNRLPPQISVPLVTLADKLNAKPFMEYAQCYALYNWKKIDSKGPISFSNLELIRAFEGSKEEAGFILVHVAMVAYTGKQVQATLKVLSSLKKKDRSSFNNALQEHFQVLRQINDVMETMWKNSSSSRYNNFRTFIMGTKNQPMFPDGVVYEGVSEEPRFYRGESGANDSIIPTADNLLELTSEMPSNPLTEILKDFRSYRPSFHNEWLSFVEKEAKSLGLQGYAMSDSTSSVYYLKNVDMIREFRSRHWLFTKDYILKYSKHPVATGGSPIVTWLPNQLSVVLKVMEKVSSAIDLSSLSQELVSTVKELKEKANTQIASLDKEVQIIAQQFPRSASEAVSY